MRFVMQPQSRIQRGYAAKKKRKNRNVYANRTTDLPSSTSYIIYYLINLTPHVRKMGKFSTTLGNCRIYKS